VAASVTVSGHVSTADGSPIQDALVEFQGIPLCPDLCTQPQTYTDGGGDYSTELPDGAYTVYAFFVYPSGGMMTLDAQQDSVIPGGGDYEVDFVMPGEDTVDGGIEPAPYGTGGSNSSGSDGRSYDWSQDPNSYQYWNDVCAGGAVCDPSNGGLPDFVSGGGLTIPGL
jgi:hypothetical protein